MKVLRVQPWVEDEEEEVPMRLVLVEEQMVLQEPQRLFVGCYSCMGHNHHLAPFLMQDLVVVKQVVEERSECYSD